MSVQIRRLIAADIAAVQALDDVAHGEHWSDRAMRDQIELDCFDHWVAIDTAGGLLGHAGTWTTGSTLTITTVAVDESCVGRGIGSQLLVRLVGQLDETVTALRLEVRPTNRRAQRLYSRFGFAPAGIERGFYERSDDSGSRDALVMVVAAPHESRWRERLGLIRTALEARGAAA